ncbi:mitochondrial carrier domain-containing protein [Scenedesmus sp. NREL 46B-D3]|nr:mitochondrial carrier domain-containing protein [Scenedesmus sp. NREL 46B-D3]
MLYKVARTAAQAGKVRQRDSSATSSAAGAVQQAPTKAASPAAASTLSQLQCWAVPALAELQQQTQRAAEHQQQLVAAGTAPKQQDQQQARLQDPQQQKRQDKQQGSPSLAFQDALSGFLAQLGQAKLLVAGAMAAVVSRTAMAPLERIKMDLLLKTSTRSATQTAMYVYEREGIAGFWKGNGLNLLRTAPFKALNFFSFDVYSKMLSNVWTDGSNSARFVAGAMAGITATLVCFPLDVLRTRLMAPWGHKYGGPLRTLQGMAKCEGLGALYAGCVPAVVGMAPSGAVFYGVYDLLKHHHLEKLNSSIAAAAALEQRQQHVDGSSTGSAQQQQRQVQQQQQHELPVLYTLLYGAVAGAAAEAFLYPLEVIRRKMQLQSMAAGAAHLAGNAQSAPNLLRQHGLKAASGALAPAGTGAGGAFGAAGVSGTAVCRISAACAAIIKADGMRGFYAGIMPNMLQVLPSAALSYGTYEAMKQVLGVVSM